MMKDKKIIIYQMQNVAEPGDMPVTACVPIHPGKLWAYYLQSSTERLYAAKAVNIEETVCFVVNYRDDIQADMVIKYKDSFYLVTRTDRFEDNKTDIRIYAKATDEPDNLKEYPKA